ncbi:MAG: hypothetical protein MI757_16300, partial [Pirellulales bacterium]|nr:hypothetical protein [Pirellulales bacterium]
MSRSCSFSVCLLIVSTIGCGQPDEIRSYKVDKDSDRPPHVAMSKPAATPAQPQPPASAQQEVSYETPEGWKPGKRVMFANVSLEATKDGETAKITVTPMGAAQAALVPNIRRWREQQLGLPPISAEEIETSAEDVPVGDATAKFFELVGP